MIVPPELPEPPLLPEGHGWRNPMRDYPYVRDEWELYRMHPQTSITLAVIRCDSRTYSVASPAPQSPLRTWRARRKLSTLRHVAREHWTVRSNARRRRTLRRSPRRGVEQALGLMTTVYRLREQTKHIKQVQDATLNTKEFGIQQTHGLFGSDTWWQKIASGELPLHTAKGRITRVFMGSMNDWPVFVMTCADGTERQHTREVNRPGLDQYYRVGAYIEVDYVVQHFKVAAPFKETAHELVVEIRIEDEA